MMRTAVTLLLAALPWVAAAQPVPAGGEFQVNTYTPGTQRYPAVAIDQAGNFVVVWVSALQDGSSLGVFGQRYAASGAALGAEFQVNVYTTNDQYAAAVAMDAGGRFVVVWSSIGQDGDSYGVFGRRYDATGGAVGGEFQVNSYTTLGQSRPAIAMNATGSFVVVYAGQDADSDGIVGQRYGATGGAVGTEFQINTYTTGRETGPRVAMAGDGAFVVVWSSQIQDGSGYGIFGQRFDATGAPAGLEFRVNTYTTLSQYRPAVAITPGGGFVVVWEGSTQDGSGYGVFGQQFNFNGDPTGGEFLVNAFTTNEQLFSAVASDATGRFVVVWTSKYQDGGGRGIFGQRYDQTGSPQGGEFAVNTYTTNDQDFPAVAMDAVGNFVVVWQSSAQDGSGVGIFGQRFGGLFPAALSVDAAGNGILEPGESVTVAPGWRNVNGAPLAFTGIGFNLAGPPGATSTFTDNAASYTVADATVGSCSNDCYHITVSRPAIRPVMHWDIGFRERISPDSLGYITDWLLHVGESFPDVPPAHPFYRFVETLLHVGVTAGCTATTYCPDGVTTREQMAVFLLRAKEGGAYAPPPCTTAPFPDVPCSSPFAAWVQELVNRGITAGCGGGLYCPTSPVTREQMAVFLLKTHDGAAFTPPACTTATFSDVPCTSPFAPWVQELVARGITAGCGGGLYCPTDPVTRGQMAVFLTKTFGLTLYGP
jgi:hypothetical protein